MKQLILILILSFSVTADPYRPLPIDFLDKEKIKKEKKKVTPSKKNRTVRISEFVD